MPLAVAASCPAHLAARMLWPRVQWVSTEVEEEEEMDQFKRKGEAWKEEKMIDLLKMRLK